MKFPVLGAAAALASAVAPASALAQEEEPQLIGGWEITCAPLEEGQPDTCRMYQELVTKEGGQRVMSITLFYVPDAEQAAAVFSLPLGVFLPAGAAFAVDEGEQFSFAFQTCDSSGCVATVPLAVEQIDSMKAGNELTVAFQTMEQQTYGLTFSLEGFTAAHDEIAPG